MTHRQFAKRPQIVATPETAERARLRRHPAQQRQGTGRKGLVQEYLVVRYCITCYKPLGQTESVLGPRRDVYLVGYEEAHSQGFYWSWSYREHAKGHREVQLTLWGVRRTGGHVDPDAYRLVVETAGRFAALEVRRSGP